MQLGNGTTASSSTPVLVMGVGGASSVSAGDRHTCVLVTGGKVRCWGNNETGQLGSGSRSAVPTAVTVVAP
jgi:alpha-tubulin suppressor-like RCC1 family protein